MKLSSKTYYSSSPSSSSTIAATVDEMVDATVITTIIQIKTINAKNANKNPSGVIILSPISQYLNTLKSKHQFLLL